MIKLKAIRTLWNISLGLGGIIFIVGLAMSNQFSRPELVPIVIIFALASAAFGGTFFIGCQFITPKLSTYIVGDKTTVEGPIVKTVTELSSSGDPEIDRWVKRYAFARNLFGMSILPLLILVGLFLFY